MNSVTLICFFLCFNIVVGLKCVTTSSDGKSTTNANCNSKYCYSVHVHGQISGVSLDQDAQGCGSDITADQVRPYNAKTCDENGSGTQKYDQGGLRAELYCCDSDLCNSATTYSFVGILAFAIFAKFLLS